MNPIELENKYAAHNYEPLPVVLARGEGAHLWDTAGRRYVDMMGAYSAASHGHGHPRILAALQAQARRLAVPSRAYYNDRLGPLLEAHPRFPERTNVQVARVDAPGEVTARVWERGVGETSASGTSAVAVGLASRN